MPIVIVSQYAYKTITSRGHVPFENSGHQRPNGDWEIFVSGDYISRVSHKMLPNESISEAIERWFPRQSAT